VRVVKNIDKADGCIISGLILLGIGLFFWFGKGPALAVPGGLLFCMGFFAGALAPKGK
jgi:uncharacterized membrane protein